MLIYLNIRLDNIIIMFSIDKHFNEKKIEKTDIIKSKAFVLHNLLTHKECNSIIDYGEKKGFHNLTVEYNPTYRKSDRCMVIDDSFSLVLMERVKKFLNLYINLDGSDKTLHQFKEIHGEWKLDSINSHFRLCKYNNGGFFKKHYDEGFNPDEFTHRTLITIMIYLNEEYDYGETIFYNNKIEEIFRLKPKTGDCLIFNQNILHEGNLVKNGKKYMIRSDIFYKLVKPYKFSHKNPSEYLKSAKEAENNKNYKLALELYQKAESIISHNKYTQ
jgi:hypothetical protein